VVTKPRTAAVPAIWRANNSIQLSHLFYAMPSMYIDETGTLS
jgi:hypothetical protein